MTTTTIEQFHADLASQAERVIPVGRRNRGNGGSWDIRCTEGTKIGVAYFTGKPVGQFSELHPCNAVIDGTEYPNAFFRDNLKFAGLPAAILVGVAL